MDKIKGIHHACICVADIERSIKWYREILGAKLLTRFDLHHPNLGKAVGIPGASLKGAMLLWGEDEFASMIEVLCYTNPIGEKYDPHTPMCNIGCTHVAFTTVNTIDDLYEELQAKGVRFYSPPQLLEIEGQAFKMCYFKDPDGITLELIGS